MSGKAGASSFEDRFSSQAAAYARHRPRYPAELFAFLAGVSPCQGHPRGIAWDCGTGSGQAAVALREHFDTVIATDASEQQIARAFPCDGVTYRVATAEQSGLADASIALVTVASALHWFDLPAFYNEVRRVLIPGGVLAAWGYRECAISPEIDAIVQRYQDEIVGPYWSAKVRIVADRYKSLDFPFEELASPPLAAYAEWSCEDLLAYLRTWSASESYLRAHGTAATDQIREALAKEWGSGVRPVRWPLFMRVGRVATTNP